MQNNPPSRNDSVATKKVRLFSLFGFQPFPRLRAQIQAMAARQQDVLRVCTLYPKRVPWDEMNTALIKLDLNPTWVYQQLAAGASIPELDTALQEVAKPW